LVRAGSSIADEGGVVHEVTKIISHAKYDIDIAYSYDITLLKVSTVLTQ
jgi:hypothetical protein